MLYVIFGGLAVITGLAGLPRGSDRIGTPGHLVSAFLMMALGTVLAEGLPGALLWVAASALNLWFAYVQWRLGRPATVKPTTGIRHRLSLAWHVFRGRPLAYRIFIEDGGIVFRENHSWAEDCVVLRAKAYAVTFADVTDCRAVGITSIGTTGVEVGVEGTL